MSSISGNAAGYIATLYRVTTVISTKDESNVETAIGTSGNKVEGVKDMSTGLTSERQIIDIPVFGEDVASKLPGQSDPGTFDFSVAFDGSDSVHTGIRDDDGKSLSTYIVVFDQGNDQKTYAVFDGYVATNSVTFAIDDVISMDVSIARDGAVTWIDNS
jgi:hypothetical protein